MDVATADPPSTTVGIRELKNQLSRYLDRVTAGETFIVTDRGRPVARLVAPGESADRLQRLIDAGIVRPPAAPRRSVPPALATRGTVSDLVAEQRR